MEAGVPQGSVLGPLLWNLTFDSTLRIDREPGRQIICYADDTLIIATGKDVGVAAHRAGIQTARVLRQIKRLGLKVSERKTEAVIVHGRLKPYNLPNILVGNSRIKLGKSMKYLGIFIDSRWSFTDHFAYVESKVAKVTIVLGRLMPNLRGPGENKRQLFAKVVQSVLFYGAPVWSLPGFQENAAVAASRAENTGYQGHFRSPHGVVRRSLPVSQDTSAVHGRCFEEESVREIFRLQEEE